MAIEHICTRCGYFEVCENRFKSSRCRHYMSEAKIKKELPEGDRRAVNRYRKRLLQKQYQIQREKQRKNLKILISLEVKALVIILVFFFPYLLKELNQALIANGVNTDIIMAFIILLSLPVLLTIIYWVFIEDKKEALYAGEKIFDKSQTLSS